MFTNLELAKIHDYLIKQRDNEFYQPEKIMIDELCRKILNKIDFEELEK
jgi:hypothetical protein